MIPTKKFEEFVQDGIVKQVAKNQNRANNLITESERKYLSLKVMLEKLGITNENANDYVEYCYDIFMHLVRAKMLLAGYNASGFGAHEAEVAYIRVLGFNENDVQFANQLRFFRNGMLYYGTRLDKVYAEKVIEFTKRMYLKLKELIT